MGIFLIILIIIGGLLEYISLHDSLKYVQFSYGPAVSETEPEAVFEVESRISNTGLMPILSLRAACFYPEAMQLPVPSEYDSRHFARVIEERFWLWGRQRLVRTMQVSVKKRGVHYFNGAKIERGDFLGLCSNAKEIHDRQEMLVYPALLQDSVLREKLGHFLGDMPARRLLMRDPILTIAAHEYSGQEPMHDISWTQTARRGQLMVREFDHTRDFSCGLILCVDGLQPTEYALMDMTAALARTAAESLTAQGVVVSFITNSALTGYQGRECVFTRAAGHMSRELLGILSRASGMAVCPALELGDELLRRETSNAEFIVAAPRDSSAVRELCGYLNRVAGTECLALFAEDYMEPDTKKEEAV